MFEKKKKNEARSIFRDGSSHPDAADNGITGTAGEEGGGEAATHFSGIKIHPTSACFVCSVDEMQE
ncbi:hypothetical protein E2C01_101193 [Portunus trituberculatus]|uniref:Uncharacterized protein n=1 Tax=Portunus trituberculatus TaxID=210409 RepID=A0A5B7KJG4_PORTR|nr:hypothetical protein [Portunus trituberculatus]